jgi:hypothetical protein
MTKQFLSNDEKKNTELSDAELDNVSGGTISGANVKPTIPILKPSGGGTVECPPAPAPSPTPTPTLPTGDSGGTTIGPNTLNFPRK